MNWRSENRKGGTANLRRGCLLGDSFFRFFSCAFFLFSSHFLFSFFFPAFAFRLLLLCLPPSHCRPLSPVAGSERRHFLPFSAFSIFFFSAIFSSFLHRCLDVRRSGSLVAFSSVSPITRETLYLFLFLLWRATEQTSPVPIFILLFLHVVFYIAWMEETLCVWRLLNSKKKAPQNQTKTQAQTKNPMKPNEAK